MDRNLTSPNPPQKRGFASMDAEKQRAIASKGGKAAHLKGTAHEFTSEEARIAGRKGGQMASHGRMKAMQQRQQQQLEAQKASSQTSRPQETRSVGQQEENYDRVWNRNNVEQHDVNNQSDTDLETRESA